MTSCPLFRFLGFFATSLVSCFLLGLGAHAIKVGDTGPGIFFIAFATIGFGTATLFKRR